MLCCVRRNCAHPASGHKQTISCFAPQQGDDCKRQLAILFSFLEDNQPTEQIKGLLGEVDNGEVNSMVLTDPGGGYTGNVPKVWCSRRRCCCCLLGLAVVLMVMLAMRVGGVMMLMAHADDDGGDASCVFCSWTRLMVVRSYRVVMLSI